MPHLISRTRFTINDIFALTKPTEGCYQLDAKTLGLRLDCQGIDDALLKRPVYDFLLYLRQDIFKYGVIELQNLDFNLCNYTLGQGAPIEHQGNPNPYMTAHCQDLHQDTPPYPTAFGLKAPRQFYATWLTNEAQMQEFYQQKASSQETLEQLHQRLVPTSLENQSGFLINQKPGLTIIDNSQANKLYHARTANFKAIEQAGNFSQDSKMYAFNEVGLLQHLRQLDIYRGNEHINLEEIERVKQLVQQENLIG